MQSRISRFLLPLTLGVAYIAFADVSTDYNHKTDFGNYHSYSWIGVKASELWQERIMGAVDSQLAAKGWTKLAANGEAAISAFGKVTEQDTLQTFYDGFPGWGWRGWGGMGTATTTITPERVGNLNVYIFDGNTKQMLWRGTATETLSSKPEKNEKKLENAVEDMFKHFPPPTKD